MSAEHVERVLRTVPGTFDTIVVDAGSNLDERTLTAFDLAELVIFPVYPEIAALNALHSLLEYLGELGSVTTKAMIVVNSIFAKEILKLRDVESALGARVEAHLPYDPFIYVKAVNEGIPIVSGAPRSAQAEAFTKLAATVFGGEGGSSNGASPTQEDRKSGLFGGLRRR